MKQRLSLSLIAILIALVGAELLARVLAPPRPSLRFEQDVDELRKIQLPQLVEVIEEDPDLFWRFKPNQRLPQENWPFFGIISNDQGFREDHPIPPGRQPGEIRILFLGDSCTFGYGVDIPQGFVEQVEQRLRRAHPTLRFECINAGVPGYSAYQGLRLLQREGPRLQPDLVVATFGWNDMSTWDGRSDLEHADARVRATPPRFLSWSRLAGLAWRRMAAPATPPPADAPARPRLNSAEFGEILGRLEETARQCGSDFAILVWAVRMNADTRVAMNMRTPLQLEMYAYGRSHPVPVIDLVPTVQALAQRQRIDEVFFDVGHATPAAHAAFAEVLGESLESWLQKRLENRGRSR